ncbi:MAG: Redox-sensing transcriptional repressor rex [candidate division Zixibacteria bacterium RBG-1]|nr:MAG: Redox-sensing transcriptional repressor rex [candidate division Zixibacteria bacterium RBG-1]OGC83347.1 MAG: redox-sensing transcriptional repressor Rex [candidate division Zixibacteria bacterium RBG_19FT_COMBO_42_43]
MQNIRKISDSTIRRLSLYYRALSNSEKDGYFTVSSQDLAKKERLTPAQVRKDLSFFGSFGTRGLGYPVKELKEKIGSILGLNRSWNVALIGVGNLGSALASYKEFQKQGFHIKLLFDNDPKKIGSSIDGIPILDIKQIGTQLKQNKIDLVIMTLPGHTAQGVAEEVVRAGVKAILNFAPVSLKVPEDVFLRNENMAIELEYLSFCLKNRNNPGKHA